MSGQTNTTTDLRRKPFEIMDFPPEVRQMIYSFAIAKEVEVDRERKDIKSERDEYRLASQGRLCRQNPKQPAITRVSTQARQESLPLFYRETRFVVCSVILIDHLNQATRRLCLHSFTFLNAVTDQNLLDIRNLDVLVYNPFGAPPPPPAPPVPIAIPALPFGPFGPFGPVGLVLAAPFAAVAPATLTNGMLPMLKLNFNIISRKVPTPTKDPIMLTMETTIGPKEMLPALTARLVDRQMTRDDFICSVDAAFMAPADYDQGEVSLDQLSGFVATLGPDITGLQLDCSVLGCPYHSEPAGEDE